MIRAESAAVSAANAGSLQRAPLSGSFITARPKTSSSAPSTPYRRAPSRPTSASSGSLGWHSLQERSLKHISQGGYRSCRERTVRHFREGSTGAGVRAGSAMTVDYAHAACEGGLMEKSSLTALAREQLRLAKRASSGRSADTVYGGHEHILRQTVIALVAGRGLSEHENPGEATVYVLRGRVRLQGNGDGWEGSPGDLLIVPEARHSLDALEDSVVLLTVAMTGS